MLRFTVPWQMAHLFWPFSLFAHQTTPLSFSHNAPHIRQLLNAIHKTTHTHNKTQPEFITFWFVCCVWFRPHINICLFAPLFATVVGSFAFLILCRRWANIDYDNKFLNRFESNSEPLRKERAMENYIARITVEVFLSTLEIPMPHYVFLCSFCGKLCDISHKNAPSIELF